MKPIFNIGKAKDRILLQGLSTISDDAGGTVGQWADLLSGDTEDDRSIWAEVKPMEGDRALRYEKTINEQPYSVKIRFNRGLDYNANYRFLFDGKIFVIHSIINYNQRDFTYELLAYTKGDAGSSNLCAPSTVQNSDESFKEVVKSGDVLELEDYDFQLEDPEGVVLSNTIVPAMVGETFLVGSGGLCPTEFPYNLNVNGVFQEEVTVDTLSNINITVKE